MHNSHTNFREKIQIVLQVIGRSLCALVFKALFRVEVIGADEAAQSVLEAQKKGKGMLFAANHTSEFDAACIRTFIPLGWFKNPMYYVSVTKEYYNKSRGVFNWQRYVYGGWMFKMIGAFPAYKGMKDFQASLVNHIELLEQQKMVTIFPEGKIYRVPDETAKVYGGIGFLADFTSTDIIPVKFEGLANIPWMKAFLGKRPVVRITYKPLLQIAGLMQNTRDKNITEQVEMYRDVAAQVMNVVRK